MRKLLPILLCLLASSSALLAGAPQPSSNLQQTLSAAAEQKKLGFILLGRATCSICNETRTMIEEGKIPVTATSYVMADLNIDDPKVHAEFMRKYGKEDFGNTLPFVVVTDSHGTALASSGGYKDAEQWKKLLRSAKAKSDKTTAAANNGGSTAGTDPNWPFKSAPAKQ